MAQTVAVDFDGVIHAYSKGWHDGTIYDEPVPGALDAIRRLQADGYAVFIHTSRNPVAVVDWCVRHGFHQHLGFALDDDVEPPITFWNDLHVVLITNRKLPAVAYIDDRAIRFQSWPQALADIKKPHGPRTAPPTAVVVEIIERGRKTDATTGGSIIVPNDVRINGVSVLTVGGVKVHEMDVRPPKEMATVTLTLPVRLLTIAAEGDLNLEESSA